MFRNDLIKKAVEREGLLAIAIRSGVAVDTVARARDGKNLSIKSLAAIVEAVGLKMRDLFVFPVENRKAAPEKSKAEGVSA